MLRYYQTDAVNNIFNAWKSHRNIMLQSETGTGKTTIFCEILKVLKTNSIAIAHRQELIVQMSNRLAANGVEHRVIAPTAIVKLCCNDHLSDYKRIFVNQSAKIAVGSIDTLPNRIENLRKWAASVEYWIIDEAHHVLKENKWGNVSNLFPNARGLGVSATPCRTDGKGLGSTSHGLFDTLIRGQEGLTLQEEGYLSPFKVYSHEINIKAEYKKLTAGGDFNPQLLARGTHEAYTQGDVVEQYLKYAAGKTGITFVTDVDLAHIVAAEFNSKGVPAAALSAKTNAADRQKIISDLKNGRILQLVNVDIAGEGFDLPAASVVSMLRATESFVVCRQQYGRVLRPEPGKVAIIIDHVGNVKRHGLPLIPTVWSLDPRPKKSSKSKVSGPPLTSCPACAFIYEKHIRACPDCGYKKEYSAADRQSIETVDGDLTEIDLTILQELRNKIKIISEDFIVPNTMRFAPAIAVAAANNRHKANQQSRINLREIMALWAGYKKQNKLDGVTRDRLFYFKFGVDALTAETLSTKDQLKLIEEIKRDIEQ